MPLSRLFSSPIDSVQKAALTAYPNPAELTKNETILYEVCLSSLYNRSLYISYDSRFFVVWEL